MKLLPKFLLISPLALMATILLFDYTFIAELILSFLPALIITWTIYLIIVSIKIRGQLILKLLNSLIICVLLMYIFSNYYQNTEPTGSEHLRVTSMNIYYKNNEFVDIYDLVKDLDSDIVILVEFYPRHNVINEDLQKLYPYVSHQNVDRYINSIKYLSKYPIVEENIVSKSSLHIIATSIKVDINGENFNVFGVHTTSPTLPGNKKARDLQIEEVKDTVLGTNNTIVAGDFNLAPWSPVYKRFDNSINSNFYNASMSQQPIFTWTLKGYLYPFTSHIDHIFVSNNMYTKNLTVSEIEGSDHKAVTVDLIF